MNGHELKQFLHKTLSEHLKKHPAMIRNMIIKIAEKALYLSEISAFLNQCGDAKNVRFIEELFDYLDFSYFVSSKDKLNIPAEGKLIIAANHPLGALDALALIKAISEVRKDVRIVANNVLSNLTQIKDLILPFNVFSLRAQKDNINLIESSLLADEAIIFFPAAEVSRMTWKGVKDGKWLNGVARFAEKHECPVLPVYIEAKNTAFFYAMSLINKRLSMFLLPREIFYKKEKSITIKVGDPIPGAAFKHKTVGTQFQSNLLRKHVYRLGKGKTQVFATEQNIIHPVDAKQIRLELKTQKLLCKVSDAKKVYLVDFMQAESVASEIARLREITFRKVGEGTGRKSDIDKFDFIYKHIALWDEENLEIAGSYRLGLCSEIIDKYGINAIYNSDHFLFSKNFEPIIYKSLELGRSFIQQKYWRSNALDMLWQGIGAYLQMNPSIEYLFGAVSISNSYSDFAKSLIVSYYRKWYSANEDYALGKRQYIVSKNLEIEIASILHGRTIAEDFKNLKSSLKALGYSVPVLFRKYVDLCNEGGAKFLDFNIDPDFSNSVDGLMLIDIKYIKEDFRSRYVNKTDIRTAQRGELTLETV